MAKFGKMEMPPMKGKKPKAKVEIDMFGDSEGIEDEGDEGEMENEPGEELPGMPEEDVGMEGEAAPVDLTSVSDDELMAEMQKRGL